MADDMIAKRAANALNAHLSSCGVGWKIIITADDIRPALLAALDPEDEALRWVLAKVHCKMNGEPEAHLPARASRHRGPA